MNENEQTRAIAWRLKLLRQASRSRRRGVAILPFGALILCASAGAGQLADTTPLPPDRLPRLIGECEAGPNYNSCSMWIWRGSSYSAIWGNGAAAELTVAGTAAHEIRFERRDTAGPLVGLTATYTGKWDGKSFSTGKMTASLKGGTNQLTWTATPAVTPVIADPQRDGVYLNWYTVPLTGLAVFNHAPFTDMVRSPLVAVIDDYRMRGEPPVDPGGFRQISLRAETGRLAKGVTYPQALAIAAIYADGTTFGDATVLGAMLEQRRRMLAALTTIGTTLCNLRRQGASLQDISSALDKQHAAEDARSQAGGVARRSAYSFVQKQIGGLFRRHMSADAATQQLLDQVDRMETGLQDPVKDAAGNPVIPPVTPPACGPSQ